MITRRIILALVGISIAAAPQFLVSSPIHAHVVSIAGICLFLWISELVPPFVPTIMLWALIPLLLAPYSTNYALAKVLADAADPVMALFFGGFALGLAAQRHGLGARLTTFALRISHNSYPKFLLLIIGITAFFSMWISNIAAAALVFACLHPVVEKLDEGSILRRTLLIGVALGANFGGLATPVGTGPNAIAIASVASTRPVSFVDWMVFAFPLMMGLLCLSFLFLVWRAWPNRDDWGPKADPATIAVVDDRFGRTAFPLLLAATAVMWITEPLHGIPAAVIALAAAAILFVSGMLSGKDLLRIDWSTLLLIAGGITLGKLLERSQIIADLAQKFPVTDSHPLATLFLLCLASASLSALMSNTATAVLLIPLAASMLPGSSTSILIAVSCSLGTPFIISTPPNAMAFGQGGVRFGDLFWPGITLMLIGCILVSLTGRAVLNFAGIQ